MSIPTGYEKLAVIGIAWKNEYVQGTAYKTMNAVYYNGSTYVALRDNPTGPPAADGANWQYLAKGFEQQLLSAITALDTSGMLGEAGATVGGQALMDAIADKVMTKLVERSSIVQTESTDPTTVPSSPYFKQVTDRVISDLAIENVSGSFNTAGFENNGFEVKRVGHILFINLNAVPKQSGTNLLVAALTGVSPVSQLNYYQYEYDSSHKATFRVLPTSTGAEIYMDTEATGFYAILSCCVLIA